MLRASEDDLWPSDQPEAQQKVPGGIPLLGLSHRAATAGPSGETDIDGVIRIHFRKRVARDRSHRDAVHQHAIDVEIPAGCCDGAVMPVICPTRQTARFTAAPG